MHTSFAFIVNGQNLVLGSYQAAGKARSVIYTMSSHESRIRDLAPKNLLDPINKFSKVVVNIQNSYT